MYNSRLNSCDFVKLEGEAGVGVQAAPYILDDLVESHTRRISYYNLQTLNSLNRTV